jgi:serine/threonine protein kinase
MQGQMILNRYRPISEAGAGGFATVQLAWDTRIQRRVAIKCIQLDDNNLTNAHPADPAFLEHQHYADAHSLENVPGLDEARTAALLSDNSIVGVYDFEVQGKTAYLIMEYVDGLTLTELLHEYSNDLSLNAIAAIFSSVAQALKIAHENQVLHLDIKPDNILINRQGQVKVTDFGLSALSSARGFGTASGGTIGYMPPEQMRRENLDARCDEWALASITYEMLTGKNPFFADDLSLAEAAIVDAELVLPSLCIDGLSSEADDVLFYALDPDREERYDNVVDFAEEMERFLGDSVKGKKELAVLVGQAREDFADEEDYVERLSVLDRWSSRGKSIFSRVWSVLNVGIIAFIALGHIPAIDGWTSPLFWGIGVLLVLAAAIKPHLGAILSLLALTIALFANSALLLALVLVASAILWWFFVGRRGNNQANSALSPALFGTAGFNQISPLLIGFLLNTKEALINIAFALILSITLAGFGSSSLLGWNTEAFWSTSTSDIQQTVGTLLTLPETWCIVISWLAAALIVRLFCLKGSRLFAAFGVLLGDALLVGGLCLGAWFASSYATFMPDPLTLGLTIGAGVLMLGVCFLGVPVREEKETLAPQSEARES